MAATREQERSASGLVATPARYGKLSPGPGMPAVEVEAHQRARLQAGMVELAGSEGYGAVTVRRLSQIAGVSTRTFYEHFQGKDECLLSTCDLIVECAVGRLTALQSEPDWRERLRRVIAELADGVAAQALAARLILIEAPAAGLGQAHRIEGICEVVLSDCFSDSRMPPMLLRGITSGVLSVVQARLLAGEEHELPDLVDELVTWARSLSDLSGAELAKLDRQSKPAKQPPRPDRPTVKGWNSEGENKDGRRLLLAAAARLATSRNYQQLTTVDIRAAAGVSRRSFDSHFDSAGDCFRAALEVRISDAFEYAVQQAPGRIWAEDVHRTISSLCWQMAGDPMLASPGSQSLFTEGPGGPRSQNRMKTFAAERFRASAPSPFERPKQAVAEASVGAVWGLLLHDAPQRPRQIPLIISWSSYIMLAPTMGACAALQVAGSRD